MLSMWIGTKRLFWAKYLGLVFSDRIKTEILNVQLKQHPYYAFYVNYFYWTGALEDPCLGAVKKYWVNNVPGAMPLASFANARVKEGIHEGWCDNPTGLFINSCKSGAKGKNVVTSDVSAWFEWARRERIAFPEGVAAGIAMSQGLVYTHNGDAVELQEMMRRYPLELKE
ncbi:hypothetical protein NIES2100_62860 [Calothrix sp. NIES-2100]|uniref:hypothetical protein n=1 Tax=Calothrix sp. NIES-2100 TaxID=1954172 RepID=UPI000B60B580|nr:hypothetical protein NIES2100_62860 [Calothrix sp. NIES-2100]